MDRITRVQRDAYRPFEVTMQRKGWEEVRRIADGLSRAISARESLYMNQAHTSVWNTVDEALKAHPFAQWLCIPLGAGLYSNLRLPEYRQFHEALDVERNALTPEEDEHAQLWSGAPPQLDNSREAQP